jgi:hypothetical protein
VKRRSRLTRARLRELLHYNPKTGEFRWRKRPSQSVRLGSSAGYAASRHAPRLICIDGRLYYAHRLAWFYKTGRWARPAIDHRDGDVGNNRWNNLRRATRSQNSANRRRPRNNTSGYKGVYLCRSGRWAAAIQNNGKSKHLGTFASPQEAHAAYVKAARKHHGEFARAE